MNFLTMTWFISVLICLVLEGSYLGVNENTVINDLSLFTTLKVGSLIPIPAPNIYFFRGVMRILLFDYSFYEGGFTILRYFWITVLDPGAVWGIGAIFAPVFANFFRVR
jgi:hypothetical protein